ncbi:hypothetical protein HAX54_018636 [Datura stramonium]|uniref:Uncharacterized protein n=1 Tax=Datura stramonium TaxID=4076 RepID=A0ABS8UNG0_DATST|nr:hypothetical protein [Datura stramonium]
MSPETNNSRINSPEPKRMPGKPPRNRRKGKDEPRKKYRKMSKQGVSDLGQNSQAACQSSKFTGQSSQGSSQLDPKSSSQSVPRCSSQPAPRSSSQLAPSTTVCGDTSRHNDNFGLTMEHVNEVAFDVTLRRFCLL